MNDISITYSKQLHFIFISYPFYKRFKMKIKWNYSENKIKTAVLGCIFAVEGMKRGE